MFIAWSIELVLSSARSETLCRSYGAVTEMRFTRTINIPPLTRLKKCALFQTRSGTR
jgi:hypothetical protein